MRFDIEKPKTWKGLSYVLNSSDLKNAIEFEKLNCNIQLVYWTPQQNHQKICSLIEAEYWLSNPNVDYARFYIRIGVVPSTERKKVMLLMSNEVLPKLINWMKRKLATDDNEIHQSGMFCLYYKDGSLSLVR